jgi:hypothetical protein
MRAQVRVGARPTIADAPDPRVQPIRVAPLTPAQLRLLARDTALDPRFRAVDRYLWRWAVSHGSGLPCFDDIVHEAKPPPLPDDEAVLLDELIRNSPSWMRNFVVMWFRSDCSIHQIAERLQIRLRGVYEQRLVALARVDGLLQGAGIRIPTWEFE